MKKEDILVIGGGLAGLMAAIQIAEKGGRVKLFSLVPVRRSHSVCAQGGINGAVNKKARGTRPGSISMTRFMAAIFWQTSLL